MKRTMRFLMIAICCIVSSAISAHVDNDKPISVAMLPAKAQAVITRHFGHQKVVLAKRSREPARAMTSCCAMVPNSSLTKGAT